MSENKIKSSSTGIFYFKLFIEFFLIAISLEIDSSVVSSEAASTPTISSTSSSNTIDDEARRRKYLSKLWGKGNKSSLKIRELDKSTISNSTAVTSNQNDNHSSYSSANDPKLPTDDNSNSVNSTKPLAVVKPIVVIKSDFGITTSTDRTPVNSEISSIDVIQTEETITVTEQQSSITTTDRTSNKKKKRHKSKDSKKKKTTTRDQSTERNRSHHHQVIQSEGIRLVGVPR